MWGNDDADSSTTLTAATWRRIVDGASVTKSAWAWYEGRRFSVTWCFADRKLWVDGDDNAQHVCDLPIDELEVEDA